MEHFQCVLSETACKSSGILTNHLFTIHKYKCLIAVLMEKIIKTYNFIRGTKRKGKFVFISLLAFLHRNRMSRLLLLRYFLPES
jgi:hypothetical protein